MLFQHIFYRTPPTAASVKKNQPISGQYSFPIPPGNDKKTCDFLMYSGSIERENQLEMF